jgi:hypothetical protein
MMKAPANTSAATQPVMARAYSGIFPRGVGLGRAQTIATTRIASGALLDLIDLSEFFARRRVRPAEAG